MNQSQRAKKHYSLVGYMLTVDIYFLLCNERARKVLFTCLANTNYYYYYHYYLYYYTLIIGIIKIIVIIIIIIIIINVTVTITTTVIIAVICYQLFYKVLASSIFSVHLSSYGCTRDARGKSRKHETKRNV